MNKNSYTVSAMPKTHSSRRLLCLAGVAFSLAIAAVPLRAAEDNQALEEQISQCLVPYQAFAKVGDGVPSSAEDIALLSSVLKMQSRGLGVAIDDLESFVTANPQSPWTLSVRANLGRYYAEHGMYGKASEQWQQVWNSSRSAQAGAEKKIADFTFAYWTKMLIGLGQVNQLKELFSQAEGRTFDKVLMQQLVNKTQAQYLAMAAQTDAAFRCGAYALNSVLRTLKPDAAFDPKDINKIPSPVTGFSMKKLADMALKAGVEMTVVKMDAATNLVVPCVVHWKRSHYAAITEKRGEMYQVIDSLYGQSRWLTAAQIQTEASGFYLVPKDQAASRFAAVSAEEASQIFGRGETFWFTDGDDSCSNFSDSDDTDDTDDADDENGPEYSPQIRDGVNQPNSGSGPEYNPQAGGSCRSCSGMPVWGVSEPYINVWLYDEPIGYQPGLGSRMTFRLAYKQRDTRDLYTGVNENYTGVGPMWNCSWVSYLSQTINITTNGTWTCDETGTNCWWVNPTYTTNFNYSATLTMGDGGVRTYPADGVTPEYFSHSVMSTAADASGFWNTCTITQPDGSKEVFGVVTPNRLVVADNQILYRTSKIDRFGNVTRFYYQANSPLLQYVVDPDGRTNTLSYTGSLITQVQDPFGRIATLRYNPSGLLTNIVDPEYISSTFQYDGQGWITKLVTPYGTNRFEYFTGTGQSDNLLLRAVRVTDAGGGTNVYMFSQWHPAYGYRCSTHWSPRQSTGLPNDLNLLAQNNTNYLAEFYKGKTTQWKHESRAGMNEQFPSHLIEYIRPPVPDGGYQTEVSIYEYATRSDSAGGGYDPKPIHIIYSMPNINGREFWYERDGLGRITKSVENYNAPDDGSTYYRTNSYVYIGADLIAHVGPNGATQGYAFNANHQVIRFTNALNEITRYTYDTPGRRTSVTTPAGLISTNIFYNAGAGFNFPQTIIDQPISRTNSYTYVNDLVYTHTDGRGLTTTNVWDGLNRLRRISYPDGTFITNSYYRLDLVQSRDRMGFTTSAGFDALRRIIAITNALGNYTLFDYCPCGALDSFQDAAGNVTGFTYDNNGNRISANYPDAYQVHYGYDTRNHLIYAVDSGGVGVTNVYDNHGQICHRLNAAGYLARKYLDLENRVTNSVNASGVSVFATYDKLGRLRTRSYPDGGVEGFGYTFGLSGPTSYTNQIGKVTYYGYDVVNRKIAETNALNYVTLFSNSPASDLLKLTDGNNSATRWGYDVYGRVTNKVDAVNNVLFIYQYDPNSRLTNRWSAAKGNTVYKYDPVGNLTNVVYPTSSQIRLSYDPMNRLTRMVDGVGTTIYGYSTAGQLLSEDGPWANDTVSRIYQNRLRSSLSVDATDGLAWTQSYGYDQARRLTNVVSAAGVFGYSYVNTENGGADPDYIHTPPSANSMIQQLTLPSGAAITNAFDANARLLNTTLISKEIGNAYDPINNAYVYIGTSNLDSYTYTYNQASQRTNVVRAAGDFVNYTYNDIGELATAIGREPAGGLTRASERLYYSYDGAGNMLTKKLSPTASFQVTYGLNSLNQITGSSLGYYNVVAGYYSAWLVSGATTMPATNVTINGTSANLYRDNTFAYTFSVTNGLNTFTAIAKDAYGRIDTNVSTVNVVISNTAYRYDLNGNLLTDGTRGFAYGDENQLISVWKTNVWRNDFAYDGKMRRRITKDFRWDIGTAAWVQTNEVHYVYDGNLVVQERDTNHTALVSYTRGTDLSGSLQGAGGIGGLLARTDHGGQAFKSWVALHGSTTNYPGNAYYHCDGNGNVTYLMDPGQQLAAKYLYDPYGNMLAMAGRLAEANTYRFSSKEWNANSGLYYYLYRFYDPNLQRWLNRDPIEERGGINLYAYVKNNPVNKIDPLGLWDYVADPEGPPGGAGAAAPAMIDIATIEALAVVDPWGAAMIAAMMADDATRKNDNKKPCPPNNGSVNQPMMGMAAPNNGVGPQHGGNVHNQMLDDYINSLPSDAQNIRKNQQQVDINGNVVGDNRPDIQYDLNGKHYNVELDTNWRNSIKHFEEIIKNDPVAPIELIF